MAKVNTNFGLNFLLKRLILENKDTQVVTLTTDYGLNDYYVAELKATILAKAKDVIFIDVSHTIATYDIVQASFFVSNVFRKFPKGTIHIIAVHNHYSRNSRMLVFEREGHFFVAPDNGVISLIFNDLKIGEIYTIDDKAMSMESLSEIFAHVVGFVKHRLPIEEIGPAVEAINKKLQIEAVITNSQVRATIVHVDHYENVIINLTQEQFEKYRNHRKFELYYKQNEPIDHISKKYGDVPVGDVLCLFNSDGFLEIAINMGKASSLLNLYKNETIQINFYDD